MHAIETPDKVALVEGDFQVTYAQLIARIEQTACALLALGLKPGDRIVLAAQKELSFVYHYFAAHLLGVVNVVVDVASPRDRLDYIIDVVKPSALFSSGLEGVNGVPCYSFNRPESDDAQ
jgi:long-chain acyl-CoA synthetase